MQEPIKIFEIGGEDLDSNDIAPIMYAAKDEQVKEKDLHKIQPEQGSRSIARADQGCECSDDDQGARMYAHHQQAVQWYQRPG